MIAYVIIYFLLSFACNYFSIFKTLECYDFCNQLILVLTMFALFNYFPYKRYLLKSLLFSIATFEGLSLFTAFFNCKVTALICIALFLLNFIHNYTREFIRAKETTEYSAKDSYILFKRNKGFYGYIISFFGLPFNSIAVIKDDILFKFKRDSHFRMYKVNPSALDDYFLFKVEDINKDKILLEIGQKWTLFNTCSIIVLRILNIKTNFLDILPSLATIKIIRKLK